MEVKIKNGEAMIDATIEMVDGVMVVSPKVVKFEPKDGDVVYAGGHYDYVFIYKDGLTSEAYYYVSLSLKSDKIELPDGGHISYVSQLRPATEEEKKLLFDKLKEEGFAWDAEKKELVKLKWKPVLGEVYFRIEFVDHEFRYADWNWKNSTYEIKSYERGWCFKTKEECQKFCDRLNNALNQVKP